MDLVTVNLRHFKITEPPAQSKAEIKSVQTMEGIEAHYPEIFQQEIGTLLGMVHLEVDQCETPVLHLLPTSLKTKLKHVLDRPQQLEVITPVDKPTPWVSSLAVAVKKSGTMRICIDPTPLNTVLEERKIPTTSAGGHTPRTLESKGVFHRRSEIWLLVLCPLTPV